MATYWSTRANYAACLDGLSPVTNWLTLANYAAYEATFTPIWLAHRIERCDSIGSPPQLKNGDNGERSKHYRSEEWMTSFPCDLCTGMSYIRLLLDDTNLKADQWRDKFVDNPYCQYNTEIETSYHYLMDCPLYDKIRNNMHHSILQQFTFVLPSWKWTVQYCSTFMKEDRWILFCVNGRGLLIIFLLYERRTFNIFLRLWKKTVQYCSTFIKEDRSILFYLHKRRLLNIALCFW